MPTSPYRFNKRAISFPRDPGTLLVDLTNAFEVHPAPTGNNSQILNGPTPRGIGIQSFSTPAQRITSTRYKANN